MKRFIAYSALTLGIATFALTGCNNSKKSDTPDSSSTTPASTDGGHDNHDGHDHDGHDHGKDGHEGHDHGKEGHDEHAGHDHGKEGHADASKIEANLAKLSAEDAALAKKQKICPVTGEALGEMGVPQKVDVNGKTVFICCKGCKSRLLKDPEKYLAKLKQ